MKYPILLSIFILMLVSCKNENQKYLSKEVIQKRIQADKEYQNYLEIKTSLYKDLVYDKWQLQKSERVKIKAEARQAKSIAEIKRIYQKNGIDSSYLIALELTWKSSAYIKKKYKKYFAKYPTLWKDLEKEALDGIVLDNEKIRANSIKTDY